MTKLINFPWKIIGIYLALSTAVLLPLLINPGYILTFDMSWVPHPPFPTTTDNLYLFTLTIHYLSLIIPSQIIQKALLLGILLTSSLGAHFLASYISKFKNPWPPFFAGILYTINPFTYDRFMDGQYLVLLGYALLPVFALYIWRFIDQPSWKSIIPPVLIALLITITSIHSIFFIFLIALASSLTALWRRRTDRHYLLNFTKWSALGLLTVLLASSYWIVPFFQGHSKTAQAINSFDERQLYTFQTVPDHTYGIPAALNPLTLYGYWGEDQDRFALPKDKMPVWGILFLFIFGLAILGIWGYWKKSSHTRMFTLTLTILLILGWIFAVGIASPPFSYINLFLYDHIHFLRGYRDPQKFIALIALGYSIMGALGLDYLLQQTSTWKDETFKMMRSFLIVLTLFLPLLYTTTMFFGFAGQLRSADYPPDWYTANDKLDSDHDNFQVLFLPWHHYMYFSFAGRVVSSPAPRFFDKPLIVSNSDELGLIPSNLESSATSYVEEKILTDHQDLGDKLNHLHVKYILLAKETDWKDYEWLEQSPDLKLLSNNQTLRIYQDLHFTP